MIKIVEVIIVKPYILRCTFDNGEVRDFYLEKHIDNNGKYSHKIFNPDYAKGFRSEVINGDKISDLAIES